MNTKDEAAPGSPSDADAVFVPVRLKRGATQGDRIDSILEIAEPLLGRRPDQAHAYIRASNGDDKLFVTLSADDTILFPKSHPLAGRPRYRWTTLHDGIEIGRLVEDAK